MLDWHSCQICYPLEIKILLLLLLLLLLLNQQLFMILLKETKLQDTCKETLSEE